jgi:glycosyltransferase involved in cell wall biosynthesis
LEKAQQPWLERNENCRMTDVSALMSGDSTQDAAAPLRVVILNQYYVPDVASTGHLLYELASDLARQGVDVSVITSRPSYGPRHTWQPAPRREIANGVAVTRLLTTRMNKDHILGRILNSLTFLAPLTWKMLLRQNRNEVFLYTTNPPYLGVIGAFVSLLRRHRYVILLHDSYPQLAVWVGKITPNGLIERIWHRFNRFIYKRAQQTIVLCEAAKRLVCDTYGVRPDLVHVVHNWADEKKLQPKPKQATDFAREHALLDCFTIMYSGNLGLYYEFETILKAAELLANEPFRLVFIGAGGKRAEIERHIQHRRLTNTLLLPYQPFHKLPDSLNACDASLVTIASGIEGISFPSKLYTSLAVGKPILAISEDWSELRQIVEENEVGFWVDLGDAEGLVRCIRALMTDNDLCSRLGRNARALLERSYTIKAAGAQYAQALRLAMPPPEPRRTHQPEQQGVRHGA